MHTDPDHPTRRRGPGIFRAFTLVELLVVVGVIAILASLLLAALPVAQERSRRTACRSNLRQMAVAAHLYGVDNRDRVPEGQDPVRRINYLPLVFTNGARGLAVYGGSSNFLDCPNLRQQFVRSNDWRWPHDRSALQFGYLYHGGRLRTPWPASGGPVTQTWSSPNRLSDDPRWVIASDIAYAAPCIKRVVVAHGRTGPLLRQLTLRADDEAGWVRETERGFAGAHVARLDGSVEWTPARSARWYRGAQESDLDNQTCMALW